MQSIEKRRTAEDRKAASYIRAGENLREALLALENAHRRLRRLYPNVEHDYRVTFDRAFEAVGDLYSAVDAEYSHAFGEPKGQLKRILRHEIPFPTEALEWEDNDE